MIGLPRLPRIHGSHEGKGRVRGTEISFWGWRFGWRFGWRGRSQHWTINRSDFKQFCLNLLY